MRFDDRLATILKLPGGDASADAAAWSQLVSLLAQNGPDLGDSQRRLALSHLTRLRPNVPLSRRKFVSAALAGKVHDREIVLHFGEDIAPVAAPVIVGATLDEIAWSAIIPKLPPTSRALLRERRDLPGAIGRLLNLYVGDTALPPGDSSASAHDEPTIQIRDLVARIEAYKQDRSFEVLRSEPPEGPQLLDRSAAFRFETDRVGILNWVEGTVRGPLIGISFAESAEPRAFGVDGQVSGAFRKRAPFRDARLRVPGASAAGGDWLVSADPCFDPEDGRFRGYRGYARRPDTQPPVSFRTDSAFGDVSADSIRQLVHELRSPLNAICGFAEMIEAQIFGPVAHPYRLRARAIVEDSRRLARVVDDIDVAARLESRDETENGRSDVLFLIEQALDRIDQKALVAGVNFRLSAAADVPLAAIDTRTGIDLIERILDETIEMAATGDRLPIDVTYNPQEIMIGIGRCDEPRPASTSTGSPVTTGRAFAQRLIARMAKAAGGRFSLIASKFTLILPHAHDSEEKTIESS